MRLPFSIFDPAFLGSLNSGPDLGPQLMEKITSHWKLDEASTTADRVDSVGSLDMEKFGAIGWTDGKHGYSVVSHVSGGLMVASDPSMAPAPGGSVTYCLWVAVTNSSGVFFSKGDAGSAGAASDLFAVSWSGGGGIFTLQVAITDSATVTINYPTSFPINAWYFIAFTMGADGNKLSINGGDWYSVGLPLVNAYTNHATSPLVVGGTYVTGSPSAQIGAVFDEISLFNEALSLDEVRWLFRHGSGRSFPFA